MNSTRHSDRRAAPLGIVQVHELIGASDDVSSLTFKMMKTQLENHFGVALGDRKAELIEILSEAM